MIVAPVSHLDVPRARLVPIEHSRLGFCGVIAIHSTSLGPAAGGCRLWRYHSREALEVDAARLARGMSYKSALAGLPFGGGKAVLQLPADPADRPAVVEAFAQAVASLEGEYVTAEDVGTTVEDMRRVREVTRYVAGLEAQGAHAGGDPGPWTALGACLAIERVADVALQRSLLGLHVVVQGVGSVGTALCKRLHAAGAQLTVTDVDRARAAQLADHLGDVRVVQAEDIFGVEADVLAPCALGAVLDTQSIERLRVKVIAGAANNQLASPEEGARLSAAAITYCPDYVVNAGGIISVAAEYLGESRAAVEVRVRAIPDRLQDILERAAKTGVAPHRVADEMAQSAIAAPRVRRLNRFAAAS